MIVEHFTASTTYSSAWNTFAANAPDVEFGERPGVCAHYVIDRDGTIHQLVSLKWRCRHTVGLNHTAIGIEHVGTSDADVMGRRAMVRSSLALTRWLQARFAIRTRDVIGHSESLSSPYHPERVAAMRDRTHGDFSKATMSSTAAGSDLAPWPGHHEASTAAALVVLVAQHARGRHAGAHRLELCGEREPEQHRERGEERPQQHRDRARERPVGRAEVLRRADPQREPPVKRSHSTAASPEPTASHDASGWRRRGEISKSSASAVTTRPTVTGQRRNSNAAPQPAASASASPATSSIAASSVAPPAVTISSSATPYLRSGGRSRSTP